jgi:chemotaxis protein CheZ
MDPTPQSQPADAALLYTRVHEITRRLHDALRELGHDKRIEASLGAVPDAKARLDFIARVTADAAEKVVNTVDAAKAQQDALGERAARIAARLGAGGDAEVLDFLREAQATSQATSAQLTEIMLAQDFHDLTGQTVRKVVDVASKVEEALLHLLLETGPVVTAPRKALDGPVADTTRTDVVANQAQVDDLLASLGF